MSLVQDAMRTWVKLVEVSQPDGYGGRTATYAAGEFVCGFGFQFFNLCFNQILLNIIKRLDDGKVLRITSDGDDKKTPRIAGLDLLSVTAEEWYEQGTGNS